MKKLLVLLAAVSLLTVSLGADFAGARGVRTRLTIHFTSGTYTANFHGKVRSRKAICRRHRKVKVIRKGHGVIGHTRSNRKGKWILRLGGTPPAGRYLAKTPRKRFRRHNHVTVCRAGKSRTISVP